MITTRERVRISELVGGLGRKRDDLREVFRDVLPLERRHCYFTNQGKSAFEQIVLAAELQRSKILVPAFFPDDFVGIFQKYEMTPVFVDVDPETYQLDVDAIPPSARDEARSLILLHTFGLPAAGPFVRAFCDEHGLVLIEDCARALGAARAGDLVGSFGQYALFSLPKCTPVREGGVALSEEPMQLHLRAAKIDVFGLLHALTLVKLPVPASIEAGLYRLLADTAVYPLEVGNYAPLAARELDPLGEYVLASYMPHYRAALARKRELAVIVRQGLTPYGFRFQADRHDEHIFTALAVEPPPEVDADSLHAYLHEHGVKASSMWRGSLGLTRFAEEAWGARRESTPVALHLARRLVQLPVSRFHTGQDAEILVSLCKQFASRATGA